jgi:hypothetical protein
VVCFCQVLGIQNLIIEGDAQVVKAICSKEINMPRYCSLLEGGNVILFIEILMEPATHLLENVAK